MAWLCVLQAKARNLAVKKLSGTKFRQMLRSGGDIPEWFAFKSVVQVCMCGWVGNGVSQAT